MSFWKYDALLRRIQTKVFRLVDLGNYRRWRYRQSKAIRGYGGILTGKRGKRRWKKVWERMIKEVLNYVQQRFLRTRTTKNSNFLTSSRKIRRRFLPKFNMITYWSLYPKRLRIFSIKMALNWFLSFFIMRLIFTVFKYMKQTVNKEFINIAGFGKYPKMKNTYFYIWNESE